MKNLKKVLAVVLVVCMAFSLMAFAGAANVKDYSDASSIKQTEAVDLFSGLGFLQGNNGAFDPAGNITREQAAKIITYMLIGSAKADALKTSVSSFSDVAASRWSAAYIQYCAANGIINGDGTGKFNPEGNVTGTQFAKMLLTAVGYGKNGEYTGANWEMTVIADATSLKIFDLDVNVSAPATREQCAQYGFNAYTKISSVVYSKDTSSYEAAKDPNGTLKGTLALQQGVRNNVSFTTTDGVVYYKWTKDGKEVTAQYSSEAVLGKSADGTSIAKLTDSTDSKYIASTDTVVTYYYNGAAVVPFTVSLAAGVTTTATVAGDIFFYNGVLYRATAAVALGSAPAVLLAGSKALDGSKGVVVTLVDTDTNKNGKANAIRVTEKNTAVLSGAPYVDTANNLVTITGICSGYNAAKVDGYTGLADKDVVLYYTDNKGTIHIEKATAVTGPITAYTSTTNVTVNSTVYKYSDLAKAGTFTTSKIDKAWVSTTVNSTLYLDNGGFIIYARTDSTAVSNLASAYVFIAAVETNATLGGTQAKAVFSDGTSSVITLTSSSALYATATGAINQFYTFAKTASGTYTLTTIGAAGQYVGSTVAGSEAGMTANLYYQNNYTYGAAARLHVINKAVAAYITDTKDDAVAGNDTVTKQAANDKTVFVYNNQTTAKYYAFTGIANAPTFAEAAATDIIYTLSVATSATTSTPIFVYATGATGTFNPGLTTGTWVYVIDGKKGVSINSSGTTINTYAAFYNGKVQNFTIAEGDDFVAQNVPGIYFVNKFDADGNGVTRIATASVSPASTYVTGCTPTYADGIISDGTNIKALSSSAVVWFVDTTNATTTGTIAMQIDPSQITGLVVAGGANVLMQQTSTTDSTIATVIISGSTK